ncbi:hypothetical protein OAF61_04790 [Pseudomonadales bacterium]|nr:hypothetical protein [Pseudomonadales bacterium]
MKRITLALLLTLSLASHAATILVDGSGQIYGAIGVEVDGSFYDVEFADGSCNSLYDGCTSLVFTNAQDAYTGQLALLDQVLNVNGAVDSESINFNFHRDSLFWCLTPVFAAGLERSGKPVR